ncbi:MAG: hypothetical protein RIC37_08175 [Gammaproteobacteria bacterium]
MDNLKLKYQYKQIDTYIQSRYIAEELHQYIVDQFATDPAFSVIPSEIWGFFTEQISSSRFDNIDIPKLKPPKMSWRGLQSRGEYYERNILPRLRRIVGDESKQVEYLDLELLEGLFCTLIEADLIAGLYNENHPRFKPGIFTGCCKYCWRETNGRTCNLHKTGSRQIKSAQRNYKSYLFHYGRLNSLSSRHDYKFSKIMPELEEVTVWAKENGFWPISKNKRKILNNLDGCGEIDYAPSSLQKHLKQAGVDQIDDTDLQIQALIRAEAWMTAMNPRNKNNKNRGWGGKRGKTTAVP